MKTRVQIAAALRRQANLLEGRSDVPRIGISPAPIVRQTVGCGAWAWIIRRYGGDFQGHTHVLGYVPFGQRGIRCNVRGQSRHPGAGSRVVVAPWNRLERFTEWASGLSNAVGMPGGSRVEAWLWAFRSVAEWLDWSTDAAPRSIGADVTGVPALVAGGRALRIALREFINPCAGWMRSRQRELAKASVLTAHSGHDPELMRQLGDLAENIRTGLA